MKRQREIITGVEIGTSSIKVVIAEFTDGDDMSILGLGEKPSLKMCKGEVLDAQIVMEQVALALQEAEKDAGVSIGKNIFLGLSGGFIETHNSNAVVVIQNENSVITDEHVVEASRNSQKVEFSQKYFMIPPTVNRYFRLSDGRVLFNPIGQKSESLTVETQYYLALSHRADTTYMLLSENLAQGLHPLVFYAPVAISTAVFPPGGNDESLGLVIDIGAGMTSIAMPTTMGFFFCGQVTIGCEHIVNDLSIAFHIPVDVARKMLEKLSVLHCTAVATKDGRTRGIRVNANGGCCIPASSIELVIEARLRELFQLVRRQLEDCGAYSWLGNEVLLSGGGALIPGIEELAGTVFNRPVRVGHAYNVSGRTELVASPKYNHVLGVIRAGHRDLQVTKQLASQQSSFKFLGDNLKKLWNATLDW